MSKGWITVKLDDLKEQEVYSMDPHNADTIKGLPWPVCKKCGLLYLRNDITNKCIRLGCNYDLHPEYLKWRNRK